LKKNSYIPSNLHTTKEKKTKMADAKDEDDEEPATSKRKFDEMATADLARVFFRTIVEKTIIDARPRIRHLQRKVRVLESR